MYDDNGNNGDLTGIFRPHNNTENDPIFLTAKRHPGVYEEWKSAQSRDRDLDPRMIAIVRLLARRAARMDYEQFVRKLMQERKITGGEEGEQ